MRVVLLKDVLENGAVKRTPSHGQMIEWKAGTEIEMSQASASKYIEREVARPVDAA